MLRPFLPLAALLLAPSLPLLAQPVVPEGGILNSASYLSPRLPGGALAPGSIFVIFGTGLGPATLAQSSFPLPTTLAGTSVRVSTGSLTVDCPLVFTFATQIAAILPSNIPAGLASLTVTVNGQSSTPRNIRVANSAFGIFTLNQAGSGPGVITNFDSPTSQPVNTALRSARPGQTLILYGTGLGPLPAGSADNAPAPVVEINRANVRVFVGQREAAVAYAGRAPGFAGLDQINFTVPSGVEGCAVPIVIQTGNLISNYASIAVSPDGGICSDPFGLSRSQLESIANGGSFKLGSLGLVKARVETVLPLVGAQAFTTDTGTGVFVEFDSDRINRGGTLGFAGVSSLGTCFVFVGPSSQIQPRDPIVPRQLEAGPLLNLNGPNGAKTIRKVPDTTLFGNYGETLASTGLGMPNTQEYLTPGAYTFNNGSGGTNAGANVGPFTATYNFPATVNWTNKDSTTTINRAQGYTVNWTGGDPSGTVQIYGYSVSENAENAITGFFNCIERASAGTFTVPASVLLALPPTPSAGLTLGAPLGGFAVGGVSNPGSFTAPGLDAGVIFSSNVILKAVTFQ